MLYYTEVCVCIFLIQIKGVKLHYDVLRSRVRDQIESLIAFYRKILYGIPHSIKLFSLEQVTQVFCSLSLSVFIVTGLAS